MLKEITTFNFGVKTKLFTFNKCIDFLAENTFCFQLIEPKVTWKALFISLSIAAAIVIHVFCW